MTKNQRIIVFGAAGSICSVLARKLAETKPKLLILYDNNETGLFDIYEELKDKCKTEFVIGDIRDREKVESTFRTYKPDIAYHGAALKHVVLLEKWPLEAYKTNVLGTINISDMAQKYGTKKMVFISSDKAVNPTSVMGKTKKKGEEICLKANSKTRFIVVRFGNVMASRGSVVEIFKKQIEENKPLTITHKFMERYFTGIPQAIEKIIEIAKIGKGGDKYTFKMEVIKVIDLAKIMIKLSGKDLRIVFTKPSKAEKFKEVLYDKKTEKLKELKNDIIQIIPIKNIQRSKDIIIYNHKK